MKWVQESFPTGGECSGLVVIYEQCVQTFWHGDRYKEDLRYLKVWLEYAGNCADSKVIYRFVEANQTGKTIILLLNLGIARWKREQERTDNREQVKVIAS